MGFALPDVMQTDVLCDAPVAPVSTETAAAKPATEASTCDTTEAVPTADFVSTEATQTAPVVLLDCDSSVDLLEA